MPRLAEPAPSARRRAFALADLAIGGLTFCLGIWAGVYAITGFRDTGGHQEFYQSEFGPAVMLACGRGLENPDTRNAPALEAFLSERSNVVDCASIPPTIRVGALDAFQRATRYLEVAVALTWRVTGVSWSRLAILPAVLFGAVATLTYFIFRLVLSRAMALLGMIPTFMSTPGLMLVPQVRDYAKGPFLLAVILCMGLLVAHPTGRGRALVLSAVAGATVGLGLGFRTDLIVALVPFLLTVAFLLPALTLTARIAAMAVFLAAFAVLAFPLLGDYSSGNNIGPVALLGLTAPFDQPLGIQPSVYEFGSQYNDSLAFTIVNSYVVRVEERRQGVDLATPEHGRASMAYVGDIAAIFPADLITRTFAAVRVMPRYFLERSLYPPPWVRSSVARFSYRIRAAVSSRLALIALPALASATIVASVASPHAAGLVALVMVGFAGASAIQFHERHFFYLQFVPWWAFGLLTETALRSATSARAVTLTQIKRGLVTCAILGVAAASLIVGSRAYQRRTAARLFEGYEMAAGTPVVLIQTPARPGRTLLAAQDWLEPLPRDAPRIRTQFLAVQFMDDLCGLETLPITVRYQATLPELDFSESLSVRLTNAPGQSTKVFLAAYDRPDDTSRFRGIEVRSDQSRCVAGISRVHGLERTPLLLTTVLQPAWREKPLYQRMR